MESGRAALAILGSRRPRRTCARAASAARQLDRDLSGPAGAGLKQVEVAAGLEDETLAIGTEIACIAAGVVRVALAVGAIRAAGVDIGGGLEAAALMVGEEVDSGRRPSTDT